MLAAGLLSSCIPNLNTPGGGVKIEVQLWFLQSHSPVSATWSGELVTRASGADAFPNAQEVANVSLPQSLNVQGPQLVKFPLAEELLPGRWDITITIQEGSTVIATANCRNLAIGDPAFVTGTPYVVRWVEDGSNDCVTEVGMPDPEPPVRDVEVASVGVAASADFGALVPISVSVLNHGDFTENIAVRLTAQPPAGASVPFNDQVATVAPDSSGQATFTWNSACAGPPGNYVFNATAFVPSDAHPENDTKSASINMTAHREIQLSNFVGPATVQKNRPGGTQFTVTVTNSGAQAESGIDIIFSDASSVDPTSNTINWLGDLPPWNLTCGQSAPRTFFHFPQTAGGGGAHTYTLTLSPTTAIPGDNPANNSVSIQVTETP